MPMNHKFDNRPSRALKTTCFHILLLWLLGGLVSAIADERYALIIGNSNYQHVATLKNPVNDARDIEKALEDLNFETRLVENTELADVKQAVEAFLQDLEQSEAVGLFFYAGHGMQVNGENYLLPVETRVDGDIEAQGYNVSLLLNGMRRAGSSTKIIILDACRDNPFLAAQIETSDSDSDSRALKNKTLKDSQTGLSKLDAPPDTLIAFSTAPGKTAADGSGRNSPYTRELVKVLKIQGLTIDKVFRRIRQAVFDKTDGQQIPWESSSLIQSFYFNPRKSLPMGF